MSAERFALLVPAGERVSQHLPWDGGGLEWSVVVLEQMTIDLRVWAKLGSPSAGARDAGSRRLLLQEHRNRQSVRGMFEPSDDDRLLVDQPGPDAERAEVTEIIFDLNNTFSWLNSKKVEIVILPTGPPPSGVPRLVVAEPASPIPRSRAAVAGPTCASVAAPALQTHLPLDSLRSSAVGAALRETLAAQLEAWLAAVEAAEQSCDGRNKDDWVPLLRLVDGVRRHMRSPEQPGADGDSQAGSNGRVAQEQLEGPSADGFTAGRALNIDDNRGATTDASLKSSESPRVRPEDGGTEDAAEHVPTLDSELLESAQVEPMAAPEAYFVNELQTDAPPNQGSFESPPALPEVGGTEAAVETPPVSDLGVSDAALAEPAGARDDEISHELHSDAPGDQGSFESPPLVPELAAVKDAAEPVLALDAEDSDAAQAALVAALESEVANELQTDAPLDQGSDACLDAPGGIDSNVNVDIMDSRELCPAEPAAAAAAAAAGAAPDPSPEGEDASSGESCALPEELALGPNDPIEVEAVLPDPPEGAASDPSPKGCDVSSGDNCALPEELLGPNDPIEVEEVLPDPPEDVDTEANGDVDQDQPRDAGTANDVDVEVEVAPVSVAPDEHEHRPGQLMVDPWDEDDDDAEEQLQLQLRREAAAEDLEDEDEEEEEEPFLTPSSKGNSTKGKAD